MFSKSVADLIFWCWQFYIHWSFKNPVPQNWLQNLLWANIRAVTIEHRTQKQYLEIHLQMEDKSSYIVWVGYLGYDFYTDVE